MHKFYMHPLGKLACCCEMIGRSGVSLLSYSNNSSLFRTLECGMYQSMTKSSKLEYVTTLLPSAKSIFLSHWVLMLTMGIRLFLPCASVGQVILCLANSNIGEGQCMCISEISLLHK